MVDTENNNEIKRLSWDEYFKKLVISTSLRSPCNRLHVGCILVKDNHMISHGYNGYLPGCEHKQVMRDGHEIATVHAEQNAIADCAKRGVCCVNSIAYITHFPCINCMKILCASGIKQIKYIDNYKNDDVVYYFSKISGVEIIKI